MGSYKNYKEKALANPEAKAEYDAAEQIMIIGFAKKVAALLWEEHQVYYAIHNSTDNKHIHFAINAVSYKTGKKWHKSKIELAELKGRIQNIWDCLNNGIPPLCIDKRTNGICFFASNEKLNSGFF